MSEISIPDTVPLSFKVRGWLARPWLLNMLFRLRGAGRVLPPVFGHRFLLLGGTYEDVQKALTRIRSLDQWATEWERIAQRRETQATEALEAGFTVTAEQYFRMAAAYYHYAEFMLFGDRANKARLYAKCASCYRQASTFFDPPAEPVNIPFRDLTLPGYLRKPHNVEYPPCVVLVNGADSVKEEVRFMDESFLARGCASLAFDGPGIGEMANQTHVPLEYEEVGTAVFDYLAARGDVDVKRIGLFGPSLGGNLVIRIAAFEHRYRACISLSGPYDAHRCWKHMMPIYRQEALHVYGVTSEAQWETLARRISLQGVVRKVKCPLLVIGGGRDVVIPGDEAKRIYAEAECSKELIYYEDADHVCVDRFYDLLPQLERWLADNL